MQHFYASFRMMCCSSAILVRKTISPDFASIREHTNILKLKDCLYIFYLKDWKVNKTNSERLYGIYIVNLNINKAQIGKLFEVIQARCAKPFVNWWSDWCLAKIHANVCMYVYFRMLCWNAKEVNYFYKISRLCIYRNHRNTIHSFRRNNQNSVIF